MGEKEGHILVCLEDTLQLREHRDRRWVEGLALEAEHLFLREKGGSKARKRAHVHSKADGLSGHPGRRSKRAV